MRWWRIEYALVAPFIIRFLSVRARSLLRVVAIS